MSNVGRTGHNSFDPYAAAPEIDTCRECAKAIHASKGKAKSQLKKTERRYKSSMQKQGPLEVYRCPHGNGWHIRHRSSQGKRLGIVTPEGEVIK